VGGACDNGRLMFLPTSKRLALAVLTVTIALRLTPAFADVANGLHYSVPNGWSSADKAGLRIVAPSDLGSGEIMMAFMLGMQPATGSPEDLIASVAGFINTDVKVNSSSDVVITDRGGAGKFYIKNFDVESKDMGAHARMVAVLVRGDRRAAILFLVTNTKVLQKYGAGMQELLNSVAIDPDAVAPVPVPAIPRTPAPATPTTRGDGHLPTGETPDLYPGSVGWLPSGRGVAIPAARVVKGSPEGMWWHFQTRANTTTAITTIFLPDGTRATNPRLGAGTLFDLDGQRKTKGTTGVGTFSVKEGAIIQTHDGFHHTDAFRSGSDNNGAWIEIGGARYYPLAPASAKDLVGTWSFSGQKFRFRADGTLAGGGAWQLDGYLLAIRNGNAPQYITTVGRTGKLLIIGTTSYSRE
jgi:hypothetical protein